MRFFFCWVYIYIKKCESHIIPFAQFISQMNVKICTLARVVLRPRFLWLDSWELRYMHTLFHEIEVWNKFRGDLLYWWALTWGHIVMRRQTRQYQSYQWVADPLTSLKQSICKCKNTHIYVYVYVYVYIHIYDSWDADTKNVTVEPPRCFLMAWCLFDPVFGPGHQPPSWRHRPAYAMSAST